MAATLSVPYYILGEVVLSFLGSPANPAVLVLHGTTGSAGTLQEPEDDEHKSSKYVMARCACASSSATISPSMRSVSATG